jgi:hypothetical protein
VARRAVSRALASAGLRERAGQAAEATARSISDAGRQASALAEVAEALAVAGLYDRAEATAQSAPEALMRVAVALARREESVRARRLIGRVWAVGHWTEPLSIIGSLAPETLTAVCDDLLMRAGSSWANDRIARA